MSIRSSVMQASALRGILSIHFLTFSKILKHCVCLSSTTGLNKQLTANSGIFNMLCTLSDCLKWFPLTISRVHPVIIASKLQHMWLLCVLKKLIDLNPR
mmetsp:Transcript_521/g.1504  ORF Transcript_521/g.1504 Transcript_521/m.1504 type:complete len:99 (+) Transcript_521:1843-2139(+)